MESRKSEFDSLLVVTKSEYIAEEMIHKKYKQEADALRAPFSLVIEHIELYYQIGRCRLCWYRFHFDGIVISPQQLDEVSTYPLTTKALIEKGYSKKDINKIFGGNLLRL
jgi:membrane dipeptidase